VIITVPEKGTDLTHSGAFTSSCPYLTNREWSFRGAMALKIPQRKWLSPEDCVWAARIRLDWSLAGCWGLQQTRNGLTIHCSLLAHQPVPVLRWKKSLVETGLPGRKPCRSSSRMALTSLFW